MLNWQNGSPCVYQEGGQQKQLPVSSYFLPLGYGFLSVSARFLNRPNRKGWEASVDGYEGSYRVSEETFATPEEAKAKALDLAKEVLNLMLVEVGAGG